MLLFGFEWVYDWALTGIKVSYQRLIESVLPVIDHNHLQIGQTTTLFGFLDAFIGIIVML